MLQQRIYTVAVLGATGAVGQRMVALLENHPWFRVVALCASERSAGKPYAEACNWTLDSAIPAYAEGMTVTNCVPVEGIDVALSALDANVAADIELAYAAAGCAVVSNARNHRMEPDVPLIIPEVNSHHLAMLDHQRRKRGWTKGCIVTNPNCSTVGLACALKPLHDAFGVMKVAVTTLQAISGAGYPGLPSLDILDNVIPYIGGEEEKMVVETRKLLGGIFEGTFYPSWMEVSAQCNRVHVRDGHLECVSVQLAKKVSRDDVLKAWRTYVSPVAELNLPTCSDAFLAYHDEQNRPQTRRDRDLGRGMTVSLGRLRECPILGWKFVVLSHNTVRGAAGAAIADAELLAAKGWLEDSSDINPAQVTS